MIGGTNDRKVDEWNVQMDMKISLIICKYQRLKFSFKFVLLAYSHAPAYIWNNRNQSLKVCVH